MKKVNLFAIAAGLLAFSCCTGTQQPKNTMTFADRYPLNAPTYVCYKAPGTITVDGKLSPGEWDDVPWSSDFTDIEGDKRPQPHYQTRAKMAHDDDGMYFAVLMEEPHVWATLMQHDTVIYYDNDFEIFLNPTNDTHNYVEYEVNALGTDWDLYLTKPYRNDGKALNCWEFAGMKSAVYVDGTLNNPKDTDKAWSVEVFIPWESIYQMAAQKGKPAEGQQMRVNFSRVEWTTEIQDGKYVKVPIKGEDKIREYNWVWAPTGIINIHLPEYWGYVQFTETVAGKGNVAFAANPDEELKWKLRQLYYRVGEYEHKFRAKPSCISELLPEEIFPADQVGGLSFHATPTLWEIVFTNGGKTWRILNDGMVQQDMPKREH